MVAGPRNRPPHSHAASEKLNSVVRVAQTGPPALFAFPLPLLTHTSWQTEFGRWFKFGLRKHKCAFNRCSISRNHPILYFPRLLLHKSAQTLLSAVIRCRRHSSHLARIRKAGVAASNRIAQDNRILEVPPCKNRRPSGLLPSGPSSVPDEVTAMSNPTSQMSSQVTISPQSKAAYLWRRPHEDFEKSDSR